MNRAADIDIRRLPHQELATARRIHAIQIAAYTQEAELLGARDFPPLRRTIARTRCPYKVPAESP